MSVCYKYFPLSSLSSFVLSLCIYKVFLTWVSYKQLQFDFLSLIKQFSLVYQIREIINQTKRKILEWDVHRWLWIPPIYSWESRSPSTCAKINSCPGLCVCPEKVWEDRSFCHSRTWINKKAFWWTQAALIFNPLCIPESMGAKYRTSKILSSIIVESI